MNDQAVNTAAINSSRNVVLSCVDVSKNYGQGNLAVSVLRGINMAISAGERVAIVGASG